MIAKVQLALLFVLIAVLRCESATSRIVGGKQVTDRKQFAYQVSLRYNGGHFCGGTLYDENHIITAAHCLYDLEKSNSKLSIVSGNLQLTDRRGNTQTRHVECKVVHEHYDQDTIQNDIALITVTENFTIDEYTKPIPLYSDVVADDLKTIVSGWGYLEKDGHVPNDLHYAEVPIYNWQKCKVRYPIILVNGMICAGVEMGSVDACQGDSGGPLVYDQKLVGVVSFGRGCAMKHSPGVYTHAYRYKEWIEKRLELEKAVDYKCESNSSVLIAWSTWLIIVSTIFAIFS